MALETLPDTEIKPKVSFFKSHKYSTEPWSSEIKNETNKMKQLMYQ